MKTIRIRLAKLLKSDLLQAVIAFFLWLLSAAFSLYVVFEFQMMILRVYMLCCSDNRWGFSVIRQWSSIILVGFWLAFTIITGEYHYQHVRQLKSWKLFAWSYGILVFLLILSWVIA
jgi:hypothetical protein